MPARYLVALFCGSFSLSLVFLYSPVRQFFQRNLHGSENRIESVLETQLDDTRLKFVKVLRQGQLYVEVYKLGPLQEGRPEMERLQQVSLGPVKSAGFKVNNQVSPLFLKEMDGSGWPELVVPIVDKSLNGQVSVFRINEDDLKLEPF